MSLTVAQLAAKIGAQVAGDGAMVIKRCAPVETSVAGDVTFLANRRYLPELETTGASAVVIAPDLPCPARLTRLLHVDPYYAFRNAMIELHGFREHPEPLSSNPTVSSSSASAGGAKPVISDHALVDRTARIGDGATLHPNVVVERGARIGARTILYPGVFIGPDASVGDDCILYPNVVVYDRCIVGDRVVLQACTVIGSDGFGHATHKGAHHKIPQTGIVVIEDDVEMGASCAIERAAMGETRIGKGTKFADLISIGHGTTVGRHCLFVSLVGVAGSVEVGDYVVLGGQVGVAGHLKIGAGVQAAGKTAIVQDVPAGQKVAGVPALPLDQAKRNALASVELWDLFKRVKRLERESTADDDSRDQ